MYREAWRATVRGVAKSDTTEATQQQQHNRRVKEKEGQSSGWIHRWATNITDVATISKP